MKKKKNFCIRFQPKGATSKSESSQPETICGGRGALGGGETHCGRCHRHGTST